MALKPRCRGAPSDGAAALPNTASSTAIIPDISRRRHCMTAVGASNPRPISRGCLAMSGGAGSELHLIAMAASTSVGASAATPVQLLERDDRAVYTTPQTTRNRAALIGLNGKQSLTDTWSLQGNLSVRGFQQHHEDGNLADVERCSNSASPQFRNHLCLADEGFSRA